MTGGDHRRLVLVHWNREEADALADPLRAGGWTVAVAHHAGLIKMSALREDPPAAIAISLRRLPSHGREVADAVWSTKWGREIGIVFVDGEEAKVAATRRRFPQARYATFKDLPALLAELG